MDLNYYDTLIALADDCPTQTSVVPAERGGKPTIATLQYQMLADNPPFTFTQKDVLFETWITRQGIPDLTDEKREALREDFFAKPQACLRSSPLPKRFGWGLLFDKQGRVALCPAESDVYTQMVEG
ncbi:DUF6157 family protein, partial [Stomatohabitans albus]|uniref:DUF6157 family protein n=1 Tax=Stomatohabitans albus TaxID=3110766 RepID=UPI00300C6FF0